uniref:Uncharacterized protein n=1 Tax=Anguilla anguilla TaxID=7936 RepID=A0A0E9XPK9_ANGAN
MYCTSNVYVCFSSGRISKHFGLLTGKAKVCV